MFTYIYVYIYKTIFIFVQFPDNSILRLNMGHIYLQTTFDCISIQFQLILLLKSNDLRSEIK